MASAESRSAIVQLRALLLADADIDPDQARRLVEAAADDMIDPGSAIELVETFLYLLLQIDPEDYGNLHDVENPKAEALAILDLVEAESRQRRKRGWFSR